MSSTTGIIKPITVNKVVMHQDQPYNAEGQFKLMDSAVRWSEGNAKAQRFMSPVGAHGDGTCSIESA